MFSPKMAAHDDVFGTSLPHRLRPAKQGTIVPIDSIIVPALQDLLGRETLGSVT